MNLKLGSTLYLILMSALVTDGAIAQSGGISSASDAKAKIANDYNAGKFKDVIADGDMLKKYDSLTPQYQLIIGQAYYKAGDFAGCVRYTKSLSGSETAMQLQARCAYEMTRASQP
jgi:hypothetical protein